MSTNTKTVWVGVTAIVALLFALALVIVVIGKMGGSEILVGLLGFAGAIVVASIQYRSAKENEIKGRLFSEKQAAYSELISTIMGLFHDAALSTKPDVAIDEEFVRKLQKTRIKLVVWGSSQTIITLDELGFVGGDREDALVTGLRWFSKMFSAIRSDLGHNDPPGVGLELALGMLKPDERAVARALLSKA